MFFCEALVVRTRERPIQSRNDYTVNTAFEGKLEGKCYRACRAAGELFDEAAIAVVRHFVEPREEHKAPIMATALETKLSKAEFVKVMGKGVLGAIPRALASLVLDRFRPDFVYYDHTRGEAGRSMPSVRDHELKLMSYNVAALAPFIAQRNGLTDARDRLEEIALEILEGDADIVGIQEAFDPLFAEKLVERLKEHYPYAIANVGPGSVVFSGNLVLSKYPIKRAEFEEFIDHAGVETTCRKGPLIVTVEKGIERFNIIVTHLNGGGPEDMRYPHGGHSCRRAQLDQVRRFAEWYFETSRHPTFLIADTNIDIAHRRSFPDGRIEDTPADPEFQKLYEDYEVNLSDFHNDGEGTDVDMKMGRGKGAVPDYIAKTKYLKDGYDARLVDLYRQNSYKASDHHAIVAIFEVTAKAPKAKL